MLTLDIATKDLHGVFVRANQIIDLAARHAMPAIYHRRDFVTAGGLASYGPIFGDGARQVGLY
jgi:putative tryptophan/tyrosine transport system substrate-binding protein